MAIRQMCTLTLLILSNWVVCTECVKTVVDLTHLVNDATLYWPGNVDFNFTIIWRGRTPKGYWYESNWFGISEHSGTHLDAPSHFLKGKWRTHQIPPSRLIGPGIVVNVTSQAAQNPNYRLRVSDLEAWEDTHGRIPVGAIVLMNSNWGVRYPDPYTVFNTRQPENLSSFHFPGFHEEAARWLATRRNTSIVGVDTPSVDFGQSTLFPVHQVLDQYNIPGLENLANLQELPAKGFTVFVGVIKLEGGSGGPARILAVIDENSGTSGGNPRVGVPVLLITAELLLVVKNMV